MEKKFDSAKDLENFIKRNKFRIEDLYKGYIDTMASYLTTRLAGKINGAPAVDFFIQGLIAISIDPNAFKSTLEKYIKDSGYEV